MAQTIDIAYRSAMSSKAINTKFSQVIGENLVYKGFNVAAGTGRALSLIKNTDATNMLFIGGAAITEDADLTDIVTVTANSSGRQRTDILYAKYNHGSDATCTYLVYKDGDTISPSEYLCKIADITVPNGFTASSQLGIILAPRMKTLGDLKGIFSGTPNNIFQIGTGGPKIKNNSGVIEFLIASEGTFADIKADQIDVTGTIGTTFQIGTGGPKIKNNGGIFELKDAADSGYASLYVKDLYVKGSTTTIDSNTVNIGDNIINLNGDMLSTSTPTEDSGILINRGNSTSAMLYWREATDKWVAGLSGSEQPIILSVTGEDITFTGNRYLKSNINTDVLNIGDSTKQGYIMLPGTNAGWVDDGGVLITSRYDSSVASAGTIRLRTYDGTNVYDWMSMDKDGNFSFNGPIVNIPTGKLGFNSGTTSGTAGIANSDTGYIYGEHDSGVENSRLVIEVGDNTNDAIVFRTLSGATKKDQMTINFDSISFATRPTFASNTAWDAGNLPNPAQTTGFTMTGDINLANARIIFNDVVASNKDYIWADDSNNEFNFVFDSSLGVAGNATLVAKNVKTSGDNSFSGENYHYSGKGSTYKNSDNTKSVRMAYNDAFNSLDIVFQ